MPSRKKKAGKQRKAAKEAAAGRILSWREAAKLSEKRKKDGICHHGYELVPSAVIAFIDSAQEVFSSDCSTTTGMRTSAMLAWLRSSNEREIAMQTLLCAGANLILRDSHPSDIDSASGIAKVLVLIENSERIEKEGRVLGTEAIAATILTALPSIRDLNEGDGNRELLRFYSKRLHCPCLNDRYIKEKKQSKKEGICDHCRVIKERKLLMVCAQCSVAQYCSKECQASDWRRHKPTCAGVSSVRELEHCS